MAVALPEIVWELRAAEKQMAYFSDKPNVYFIPHRWRYASMQMGDGRLLNPLHSRFAPRGHSVR